MPESTATAVTIDKMGDDVRAVGGSHFVLPAEQAAVSAALSSGRYGLCHLFDDCYQVLAGPLSLTL
ncbi:hypothetical protein FCJ61_36730 [Burkholderia metallica]|uniref:hypothetical protein n=1 Tax=Burkholderia metallica TaxID=488729 RepID=UPI00157AF38C|nr:hypothetical protein [Burkholderia metallica]NTZ88388.1 hypothetical protein [Burkholderia metallica]